MAIVRNLAVRAVADFSDLNKKMKTAGQNVNAFGNQLHGSMKGLKGGFMMAQVGANLLTEAILHLKDVMMAPIDDAAKYEVAFNQVNRTMGKSAEGFTKWTETVGSAFGYSRLQAMQSGATFSTLFQSFTDDQETLAYRTAEMMKATAVVSSTTGRTIEDSFERIRSGILGNTEAIEDLGVSVGETTLANSQAYHELANGEPYSKLSEKIKQQIRYQEILNQITRKYGNEVVDSTATRLQFFRNALLDIRLAWGQAFTPILNIALPYLTALAQKIAYVMRLFAAFMRFFFKKGNIPSGTKQLTNQNNAYNQQTQAINNTSDAVKKLTKAKKEASRGVAGFDEINQLSATDTGTDGGEGGGGTGAISIPPIDTTPLDNWNNLITDVDKKVKQMQQDMEDWWANVKTKFEPFNQQWTNLKDGVLSVWDGLKALWDNPFMQDLVKGIWESTVVALQIAFDTLGNSLEVVGDFFQIIGDILNGDWSEAWKDTKALINDFYDIFQDICVDLFPDFSDQIKQGKKDWIDVFTQLGEQIKKAWDVLSNMSWDSVTKTMKDYWNNTIVPWFKTDVVGKIKEALVGKDGVSGGTIMNNFKNGWGDITKWFDENVVSKMKQAYDNVTGSTLFWYLRQGWGDISKWFNDYVVARMKWAYDNITGSTLFYYLKQGWGDIKKWFTDNVVSKIKSAFASMNSGLGGTIANAFKTIYNRAVGYLNSAIDMINKVGDAIDSKLPGNQIKHIPHIPKLAQGGITGVNSPQLAMVGDNRTQREVISPLDDLMGMISTAVSTAMAFNGGGNKTGGDVNLSIDGRMFARIIKPYMDQEQQRIGTNIRLNNI